MRSGRCSAGRCPGNAGRWRISRSAALRRPRPTHTRARTSAAALERHLDRLQHPRAFGVAEAETVGHDIQHLAPHRRRRGPGRPGLGLFRRRLLFRGLAIGDRYGGDFLALRLHAGVSADRQPLRDLVGRRVQRQFDRKGHDQARVAAGRQFGQLRKNGLRRVVPHRLRRGPVEQLAGAREQQLQVVVEFRHRADRGARRAHRIGLVDGNRRRPFHRRLVHAVQELARIGRKRLDVTALAFRIQGVEHQAGLARSAGAGYDGQFTGADVQIEILEVVLAGSADTDGSLGHGWLLSEWAKHSRQPSCRPAA